MARICFVCNEIYPTTPGGAGALVYNLAQALLDEGNEIIFLLDLSRDAFQRFDTVDRYLLPNPSNCRAYHVDQLCGEIPYREKEFTSLFLWESYRNDYAGRQVYEFEKPDLIEFVDYCGPAYFALCSKIAGISYHRSHITVRIHGSVESIDRHTRGRSLDFDRYTIYALERFSLRLAESVLYPTNSSLQEYKQAGHAPWFGNAILAQPVIPEKLQRDKLDADANIALFYGRLATVKGVDPFVDAAVLYFIENPGSVLDFYLVGYDSKDTPDQMGMSFQDYLLRKIPEQYKKRFVFTGFLRKDQFEELLPKVKFAIFPSYYESFCLAAHELRRAGIPLIVSAIPAFKDHFHPGVDALFFDGSIGDLAKQIELLDTDVKVRQALSQPYLSESLDGCKFYQSETHTSWIQPFQTNAKNNLLIMIIDDGLGSSLITNTLDSIANIPSEGVQTLILRKNQGNEKSHSNHWLLGNWYGFYDQVGNSVIPTSVYLKDSLIILRSGDKLSFQFVDQSLKVLTRQTQISFVGSWKWICQGDEKRLYTHPVAAMVELAPLEAISALNRCIMRTMPGSLLIDLFDPKDNILSEVGYLWELDNEQTCGIQLPEPYVWQEPEAFYPVEIDQLSRLILKIPQTNKLINLVRYLTILVKSFPDSLLPLQKYWAERSLITPAQPRNSLPSIVPKQTFSARLSKKLSKGGPYSQKLLLFLRKPWSILKRLL